MSDDQLSWEKLFSTGAPNPKSEAKTDASKPKRPGSKSRSGGDVRSNDRDNTLFSKLDWSPLGPPPTEKTETQTTPAKPAALSEEAAPRVVAQTTTTQVKVSKTELTRAPGKKLAEPAAVETEVKTSVLQKTTSFVQVPMARQLPVIDDEESDALEVPGDEPQVISVYELNKQIRSTLEGKFPLIWVKGEISNFKAHTSGHYYFSLKDSKAQISAVMFRGFNQQLKFRPEDGMEVIVRGRVTVYEPRGNYQMFCEMMEPVGAGALQKAFEQLKAKLQAEGLFDPSRKRPLPALPKHIAIVTSPTGAAIRDMLNVLGRRFKGLRITVVPTKVQGVQAAGEICEAIELANRLKDVDVMIVGRGGGSIEDMWCFNEEAVARAISAARVPVISAVGHEIDFTIADFVADLRAPTPSAAAELVVKNAADLQSRIDGLQRGLRLAKLRKIETLKQRGDSLAKRLIDPQRRIQDCMLRCDELSQRLESGMGRRFQERRMHVALLREKLGNPETRIRSDKQAIDSLAQRLAVGWKNLHEGKRCEIEKHMALLDSLSPLRVVERGYSLVTFEGKVINDVAQVKEGEMVCIQFARGRASAEIKKIENKKGVTDRE